VKQLIRNIKQAKWTPRNIGLFMSTIKMVGDIRHQASYIFKKNFIIIISKKTRAKQLLMLICFGETDGTTTLLRIYDL